MYKSSPMQVAEILFGVEPGEKEKLAEQIKLATSLYKVDDPVVVKHTSYTGVITGFNNRLGGLYTGARYPLFVKITSTTNEKRQDAVGCTFEYMLDQIEKL